MIDKLPPLEQLIKDFKDVKFDENKKNIINFDNILQANLNKSKTDTIKNFKPYFDLKPLKEMKTPEEVATAFQTILFEMMLKEMKNSIETLSSGSFSNKMYTDMFFMQLAQVLAESNQTGLKDYILNAINSYIKNQHNEG